jgi:hypothetical protein
VEKEKLREQDKGNLMDKMKGDNPWAKDRADRYVGTCGCAALIIYLVVTFLAIGGFVIYLAILGLQALGLK